ncbi:hypothetical protein JCM12296A_11590 [Desulfosarcina cetonica]
MSLKRRIEQELGHVRDITCKHIQENIPVRFDYDCKLYREGTIRDIIEIVNRLGKRNTHILDLGCGFGGISAVLSSFGFKVQGIDIRETSEYYDHFQMKPEDFIHVWQDLQKNYPRLQLSFYNPHSLPFNNAMFDAVVYYASLEHMPKDKAQISLEEAYRVLKDDGLLFIYRCPNSISLCENLSKKMGLPSHEILYSETELMSLVSQSGFRIRKLNKSDLLPAFFPVNMQRLIDCNGFWLLSFQKFIEQSSLAIFAHHFGVIADKGTGSVE